MIPCILAHCRRHSSSLGPDRHSSLLIDGPTHSNQPLLLLTSPFSDTVLPTPESSYQRGYLTPCLSKTPLKSYWGHEAFFSLPLQP